MTVTNLLADTQHAFDGVAPGYDRSNAENRTICAMRQHLWRAVDACVPQGAALLDLGCGPGRDIEYFAAGGYRVTGIDWSPAMVHEATQRLSATHRPGTGHQALVPVYPAPEVLHLGIHELDRLAPSLFDAAYSDLGPLNCMPDLPEAARLIADRLRSGGVLIASVIGRVCPWELALYAARRDWRRASIRFSPSLTAVPLEGRTVWTRYYSPSEFDQAFAAAGFRRVSLRTLGLFVPPPYMQAFADRHPSAIRWLQRIEDVVGDWPVFRRWGDHFLIVMRKT